MFAGREFNFGGLLLEPNIVYFKDFRQEFIKFIIKEENSDIISMIPDDILSLCDLKFFKYNNLSTIEKYNEQLINLLFNFLNENTIISGRFPSYLSRYINNYHQTIFKKVPSFCDVIKKESSTNNNNEVFNKVIGKKKDNKNRYDKTSNCIMVRNIDSSITYNDLKLLLNDNHFNPIPYKNSKAINFPYDKKTNKRLNYAFITFASIDESIRAKKFLDGLTLKSCVLNVLDAKGNF